MKVVAYVRVSSARQREAYGPDVQRADIKRWAKENGHRIVAWHEDAVSGATELDDREGWMTAASIIKSGKADGIVVARLDRLARDVIVQEMLLRNMSRLGGVVLSTRDSENEMIGGDASDPSRELVRTILGAISEYDRKMTVARLAASRKVKAASGGYAHGTEPYGYRSRGGKLVAVPAEQRALSMMKELAAVGHTLTDIAQRLNDDGVPTRRGGTWRHGTVARILKRHNESKAVA